MSRLSTGSVTPIIRETDLDEVVPLALAGVPDGSVTLDIPESLPMVASDPGLLERAAANVVENAVKYSPPGTLVLVAASVLRDRVELRVVDRAPGCPTRRRTPSSNPSSGTGTGRAAAASDSASPSPVASPRPWAAP